MQGVKLRKWMKNFFLNDRLWGHTESLKTWEGS